jgi:hypothetical protein
MMEAVSTSEMSVNFYQTTWRNIPEDSHLHTHRQENLKSHPVTMLFYILQKKKRERESTVSKVAYSFNMHLTSFRG